MVCVHYKKTSIYLCVGPKEPDFLVAFKFVMSNRSPGSLKVFKSVFFFKTLAAFSLIFNPVVESDHFQGNV